MRSVVPPPDELSPFRRRIGQPEHARDRVRVLRGRLLVAERLELLGRREQQLLDDEVRNLVDTGARFVAGLGRQARQLEVEPVELGAAD